MRYIPCGPGESLSLDVGYRSPLEADYAASIPGVERIGGSEIRISGSSAVDVYRLFLWRVRLTTLLP